MPWVIDDVEGRYISLQQVLAWLHIFMRNSLSFDQYLGEQIRTYIMYMILNLGIILPYQQLLIKQLLYLYEYLCLKICDVYRIVVCYFTTGTHVKIKMLILKKNPKKCKMLLATTMSSLIFYHIISDDKQYHR